VYRRLAGVWRLRLPIVALLLLVCGSTFVQSSRALAAYPPTNLYTGWVTVLVPVTELGTGNQYRLNTIPVSNGDRPTMAYSLTACGTDATQGWLLVGGDARLSGARIFGTATMLKSQTVQISSDAGESQPRPGPVQIFRFSIADPPKCFYKRLIASRAFGGSGFRVEGRVQAPTALSVKTWPFESPRQVLSLPHTGGISGFSTSILGAFRVRQLTSQALVRPGSLIAEVSGGILRVPGLIESARPPVAAEPEVAWKSFHALHPIVIYAEPAAAARLQLWSSFAALLTGTLFGVFLTLLLEKVRPLGSTSSGVETRPEPGTRPGRDDFKWWRRAAVVALIALAAIRFRTGSKEGRDRAH
jgi:hypothetical protein